MKERTSHDRTILFIMLGVILLGGGDGISLLALSRMSLPLMIGAVVIAFLGAAMWLWHL